MDTAIILVVYVLGGVVCAYIATRCDTYKYGDWDVNDVTLLCLLWAAALPIYIMFQGMKWMVRKISNE